MVGGSKECLFATNIDAHRFLHCPNVIGDEDEIGSRYVSEYIETRALLYSILVIKLRVKE